MIKTSQLLDIYNHLPAPLRHMAASARGLYLRRWRYGPDTESLVAAALERDTWSQSQWDTWRDEQLALTLHHAATRVPYYRERWAQRRRAGDQASWEVLANWPILEKSTLRADPRLFISEDQDIRTMFHEHTSGTTGTPVNLWWSPESVRAWYALFEARWRRWYNINRKTRWAILGGQLVTPVSAVRPPFWVWNAAANQLYMSSYHLSKQYASYYLDALKRYEVEYIYAYTSSVYALAQMANEIGRRDLTMKVVITNAEPVFAYQRHAIESAFNCPVRETYGQAEIVAAAGECQHGALHLWPEVGVLEVFEDDQPVRLGSSGEFVATGLLNLGMPLVRYKLGDRGNLGVRSRCACGRTLPVLAAVEGRSDDVILTPDGRRVGRLDPVFKKELPIVEAQIVQERIDHIHVNVVPAKGYGEADGRAIVSRLKDRLGVEVNVTIGIVDHIPRTKSGKFRAVISKLSPQHGETDA